MYKIYFISYFLIGPTNIVVINLKWGFQSLNFKKNTINWRRKNYAGSIKDRTH